eukprot:gene57059-biopygen46309
MPNSSLHDPHPDPSNAVPQSLQVESLRIEPTHKPVTLAGMNRVGFLSAAAAEPSSVAEWIRAETEWTMEVVTRNRGVLGTFEADHRFLTFGAVKMCTAHRCAATRCVWDLASSTESLAVRVAQPTLPELVTAGVCVGKLFCGSFGSEVSLRFMCIGGASSLLLVLERLAARWRVPLLADAPTAGTRDHVVYPKRGDDKPLVLSEIVGEKRALGTDDGNDCVEWTNR